MERKNDAMRALEKQAQSCRDCPLCETRTKVVFGTGCESARIMLVGEGPGYNEDMQGEPFVGQAGMLLDRMLRGAGFSRGENVYIANMVKCRPPGNRDPLPEETAACRKYLDRQIAIVAPKIIVCLGRIAAQGMIDPNFKVTTQHGRFFEKDGVLYMGTFHPAALLRNLSNKPDSFADLLAARDKLEEIQCC